MQIIVNIHDLIAIVKEYEKNKDFSEVAIIDNNGNICITAIY